MKRHGEWVAKVAASAVIRRLVYLGLALVLAWAGIGKAQAGKYGCDNGFECDQGNAYHLCMKHAVEIEVTPAGQSPKCWVQPNAVTPTSYVAGTTNGFSGSFPNRRYYFAQMCLARNAEANPSNTPVTRAWSKHCVAGCTFAMQGTGKKIINQTLGSGSTGTLWQGVFEYTGEICSGDKYGDNLAQADDPKDPDPLRAPKEECVKAGTQTMCIKPNGDQCHTASTGRQICWTPGETGEKTDGPAVQARQNGNTPPAAPATPPPPGAQHTPGPATTTTTSGGGGPTTTVTGRTWTTTTGAPAGGSNQGEPGGQPGGTPGGQEGGEENSTTGGADCETQPTGTGDEILSNVLLQTWKTRCAMEDNKSNGAVECAAEFTCAGEEILCTLAMEKRKARCMQEALNQQNADDVQANIAAGDGLGEYSEASMFHSFGSGDIDSNLLGGGDVAVCDLSLTIGGTPLIFDAAWWQVVALIKFLLAAMAYLWIARQLGR